jgi:hypothetical protein
MSVGFAGGVCRGKKLAAALFDVPPKLSSPGRYMVRSRMKNARNSVCVRQI